MEGMSETVEDWTLAQRARPPLLGELVERIDEALATARASESAVMTVGAAAFDAAEEARRAADLAERASAAALAASERPPAPPGVANGAAPSTGGSAMDDFSARADRLAERLRRLQRVPLPV